MADNKEALLSELRQKTSQIRDAVNGHDVLTISLESRKERTIQTIDDREDRIIRRRIENTIGETSPPRKGRPWCFPSWDNFVVRFSTIGEYGGTPGSTSFRRETPGSPTPPLSGGLGKHSSVALRRSGWTTEGSPAPSGWTVGDRRDLRSWTVTNLLERRKWNQDFQRFTVRKNLDEALQENHRLLFRLSTQQKLIERLWKRIDDLQKELIHEKLRPGGSDFQKARQRNLDKMKP